MDYTAEELEDLATMRELRLRLRACADAKIAECEAMLPAKNWLDMTRQIKAIMAADRMVISLYSPPPRRRSSAKRQRHDAPANPPPPHVPSDTVPAASSSPHFPNGEVSAKPTEGSPWERSGAAEQKSRPPAEPAPAQTRISDVTAYIDNLTHGFARWAGIWPDGAPYTASEAGWRAHTLTAPIPFSPDDDVDPTEWMREESLHGVNAITRAHGAKTGYRHDHQPYAAGDPDYWSLSANAWSETQGPATGEIPGPDCLPWWIVRQPPP